jgi:hypothetical protein
MKLRLIGAFAFALGVSGLASIAGAVPAGASPGDWARTLTTIEVPGSINTNLVAINDSDTLAGYYVDSSHAQHAFVDHAGTFTTIEVPGSINTNLVAINDSDTLAGYYVDSSHAQHAFTLSRTEHTTPGG